MSHSHISHSHIQADLAFARAAQDALVEYAQAGSSRDDVLFIASVGDLQVRIDAAEALRVRAGHSPAASVVAQLAAAEAARLALELHHELTGRGLPRPALTNPAPTVASLRRQLGDHYLNATPLV